MTVWHLHGLVLPEGVERDLYVADGRITFEPLPDATTLARDVVLVPGLVDVHAHLSLHSPAGDAAPPGERVRASARAHLDAGVLAVREPGSPDLASHGLGPAEALPRVTTAGRFLAPPGRYFPGLAREVPEAELTSAALEELAGSDGWVKVIGDFPVEDAIRPTYGAEALAGAVREVHGAGGRVAVHCTLPEVADAALTAGVDSLEHATFLAPDQLPALRDSGAAWVPTLTINPMIRSLLPPALAPLLDRHPEVVRAAAEAGVTVLAGTDAGMGPHGMVRHEVALLNRAGLSPAEALGAGSWAARAFLGLPGLEEGAPADLTAYRQDPRTSLAALADPAVVILGGRLVRSASA